MTALSAKLQDFITQSNLKEDVGEWLVSVGILGYEEMAPPPLGGRSWWIWTFRGKRMRLDNSADNST